MNHKRSREPSPCRVLLGDDHPVFLAGIRNYFEMRRDFEIVGEATNGKDCITLLAKLQPDWAVIDLAMPKSTGFDVLAAALKCSPQTRIILISMYADQAYAKQAEELGAIGYITKEDAISELDKALQLEHGEFFKGRSVGRPRPAIINNSVHEEFDSLTQTERKILLYLGEGSTSREIAEALDISPRTVQKHRQNMIGKLGLVGPNRLLEYAVRNFRRLKQQ